MTTFHKIAVLMGGMSAEREVSLSSGRGVVAALREEGFDALPLDPGPNPGQQLFEAKPDAVFNALHGRFGEDGTVQGLMELMRIPYTHSGVLSSALAMHKERTKDIYRAAGLPVVKSIVADRREVAKVHLMEPPYVIKPVNEGSSVGIYIIRKGDNRPPAELGADTALVGAVSSAVSIPVIASSGAGAPEHFSAVFNATKASAALAAGIFHRNEVRIADVKGRMHSDGIPTRLE